MFPRVAVVFVSAVLSGSLIAQSSQLERGRKAIHDRAGCYLVDYSFTETDSMKPGYERDREVYEVNTNKSVKEWIYTEDLSPTRIRLQHVLFADKLDGKVVTESLLKHTGEEWQFNAPFLYEYLGTNTWTVKDLKATPDLWTRRVTALDDGLRYQCAAAWKDGREYADWSCEGLAPIPGRETRDRSRKDYQDLNRTSEIVVYDRNWLERERNTKLIDTGGVKAPLAKELGKTWYVRLPDAECAQAQAFVKERRAFWAITREAWDEVLTGDSTWMDASVEKGKPSRYEQIEELEEGYVKKDLRDPKVRAEAKADVLRVIRAGRKM